MIIITAPAKNVTISKDLFKVFIAGGITNCPPWQPELIKILEEKYNPRSMVILNPRRDNFNIEDPTVSEEQIRWEHFWLSQANLVSFWFSSGPSMQPITLYEYGKYSTKDKSKVVVGVDPQYQRSFDVRFQSSLEGIVVVDSLEVLAEEIMRKYNTRNDKSN